MKKKYRVRKTQEFDQIMKKKKFYTCPSFVLYVKPRVGDHARFGISAGKKLGNAVIRNKVKRQVRMMIQQICTFDEDFDAILLVRDKYMQENYDTNKKRLETLVKKVKIDR
ncbi:MAG: ribonuclease P protein component [Erysipelotrichaceae bacterium]